MIAIGGTIGTGLFIGSGLVLGAVGPLGTLLNFVIAGMMVFCVCMSLGEMATMIPVTGSFNEYAARFHSEAFGFTSAWVYWFIWAVVFPVELQACGVFLNYWLPNVHPVWFYMGILIILLATNLFTVAGFGEVEYWLSFIKVFAIVIFIFVALFVIFGQNLGFANYNVRDGVFAGAGFWKLLSKLPSAVFAFGGTELVGITAGEAANPRKSIPQAIKGTFIRVSLFYVLTIFLMGLAIPYNYLDNVEKGAKVSISPFIAVMVKASIPGADHFINFISFVAVFSAGNSALYASSRTMMALCKKGYGPKMLSKTSANGVPVLQLLITASFGLLTLLTVVFGAEEIFIWMVNLLGNLIGVAWLFICICHVYFRRAYIAQGKKVEDLPYVSPVGVIADYIVIALLLFVLIFAGITDYFLGAPFILGGTTGFVANYIYLLPVVALYICGISMFGASVKSPMEVDLVTGHVDSHDKEFENDKGPTTTWGKFIDMVA
ncbi:amino acid permease/ SLC12A domain-containing protein [Globomyces pollinis-pini]|nr:amino acid permease/ SLC12A domain-containing protein [Globomyces pollinis-pini]